MSADAPSTGYTVAENLDKSRSYVCDFCPNYAPDIDSARAHRNVHVLGPELLEAAKEVLGTRGQARGAHTMADYHALIHSTRAAADRLAAVVAKADPTRG